MSDVFSRRSLQFLKNVKLQNNREWYAQNKPVYEKWLLLPFKRLVEELSLTIVDIDSHIETMPMVDKTISRIYRDVRFSHDKTLYRDNMWLVFKRKLKSKYQYPAFFFELYPDSYRYGLGFYNAHPKFMELFRKAIDEDEKGFLKMVLAVKKSGFVAEGDFYKKKRCQNAQLVDWYDRKNIFMVHNSDAVDEIFDFDFLVKRLRKGFNSLSGLYGFFIKLMELLPDEREQNKFIRYKDLDIY